MKRRVRKIVNFFAFNLLFFALYLNFIHKDNVATAAIPQTNNQVSTAAFSGTILAENPGQLQRKEETPAVVEPATTENNTEETNSQPLRLSIN
jgi:hypothetical protein